MKLLLRALIALVVLIVVGVIVALMTLDSIAKGIVESAGTRAVGVPVTLSSISIKPLAGSAAISELAVANPPGYRAEKILVLDRGDIEVALRSLLSDQPNVPVIALDGVAVNIEQKVGGSNLKDLLNGMQAGSNATASADSKAQRFQVDELSIKDIRVTAQILPVGGAATDLSFTIDEISIKDLDEQNAQGLVLDEVINKAVGAILAAVVQQLAIKAPGELIAGLGNAIDSLGLPDATMKVGGGIVDLGKGIGGAAGQAVQGVGEAVGQGLEGIGKGLGDLIGGNKD
ncbi:MAG: hypothetical protein ACO3ZY_00660 [Phycisphaerales bacterium]